MVPLELTATSGSLAWFLTPFLVGVGFGAVLEMSGFGDSRKLAAQFYLKDLTVLKVMFSAIVVAAVLLTLGSALGLVDLTRVWVNPTFLLPGLVGGLIMGVGFIVGGFCPGTSLVAASTLKIDGVVFVAGVAIGVFGFGESVALFDGFWHGTAFGRWTLPELFGADAGVVVAAVVGVALFVFVLAELAEATFGRRTPPEQRRALPRRPLAWAWGSALLVLAALAAFVGQPDAAARWEQIAEEESQRLTSGAVYVHPMEIAELIQDTAVYTRVIDVRAEAHFNLFHVRKSTHLPLERLKDPAFAQALMGAPGNTVTFTISNDDRDATEAWKLLRAHGVPNVYIAEGGINRWLEIFPPPPCLAAPRSGAREPESLAFTFQRAVGDCCSQAYPPIRHKALPTDCYLAANPQDEAIRSKAGHHEPPKLAIPFERKVKLQRKKKASGGCG
jgi:hypothetical protein